MFRNSFLKKEKYEICFVAAVFVLLLIWVRILPFDYGADEQMRYNVAQYIYQHGRLPHGDDPEIRNEIWGISYAFNPILSYIISAGFMRVMSIFKDTPYALLIAARMVNVLLGTGMAYFIRRIARELFPNKAMGWMFTALVVFLPQNLFVFSYVNNDGMALFSASIIVYMWVLAAKKGWTNQICTGLGIGIGLLALSYYNAYGWALCSILYYTVTMLWCQGKKPDWKQWLIKGLWIAAVVLVIAGWWFIRNYIIYDGDFLGQATSRACGILYAQEPYKPGNTFCGEKLGTGLIGMFFYQHPGWIHNWIVTVAVSFVGVFGRMSVYMPYLWSKLYFLGFGIGIIGALVNVRELFSLKTVAYKKFSQKLEDGKVCGTLKVMGENLRWSSVFHWCMGIAMVIPFILLCHYSYSSDMQAQGRYILPMAIPFMYFITSGYEYLLNRFLKSEKLRTVIFYAGAVVVTVSALLVTAFVFAPAFKDM